jgi:hypothetical protein
MEANWWPRLLAHIPQERPWAERSVTVASLRTVENGRFWPGERSSQTVLVPEADLPAVLAAPARLAYQVSSSGPHPGAEAAGNYEPRFWVGANDLPRASYEPLVLSWTSHDRTVLAPDPGFLMTYGLVPRTKTGGKTVYDDPRRPTFDVVEVDPPSVWDSPRRTPSQVRIQRDYLQDYLTLRGAALFEVYYEMQWGDPDADDLCVLGERRSLWHEFPDRHLQVNRETSDGHLRLCAQVWGARMIARPADMPITAESLGLDGLTWPGHASPARKPFVAPPGARDHVYVRDSVLAAYEGKPEFRIHPETGSVTFGTQWSVGFCIRVGRDVVRLELRKLYEGAPPTVIRHWHSHAVDPTPDLTRPEACGERNVAKRAKDIVLSFAKIGVRLNDMAEAVSFTNATPEAFVRLAEADLTYHGWWAHERVEPVTRHVPIDLDRDGFFQRCVALNNLLAEGLSPKTLRKLVVAIGEPPEGVNGLGGLKLLHHIVRMAQVAVASGHTLPSHAKQVRDELRSSGTSPALPLEHLFALHDLRIAGSHAVDDAQRKLDEALARFGVEPGDYAGGFGLVLDRVYDAIGEELERVLQILSAVVEEHLD